VYLEAVSVLPQLRMMQNSKVVERFTAHYVFCLGLSRFFSCAHWILQLLEGNRYLLNALGSGLWPVMVLLSEIVQTFILADFWCVVVALLLLRRLAGCNVIEELLGVWEGMLLPGLVNLMCRFADFLVHQRLRISGLQGNAYTYYICCRPFAAVHPIKCCIDQCMRFTNPGAPSCPAALVLLPAAASTTSRAMQRALASCACLQASSKP
jgi:hypothetical protein